jgi:hypothetical protein
MTERLNGFSEEELAEFMQDATLESGRRIVREDIKEDEIKVRPYPQKRELREEKILELL